VKIVGEESLSPSQCRVISIPSLLECRELCFKLTDEWESGKSISHHGHRVTLCNTFLAIHMVASAIMVMDHEGAPVAVSIKSIGYQEATHVKQPIT